MGIPHLGNSGEFPDAQRVLVVTRWRSIGRKHGCGSGDKIRTTFRITCMITSKPVQKPSPGGLVQPGLLRSISLLALILAGVCLQPELLRAVPTNSPPRVLILDETVVSDTNSWEALAAQAAIPGCAVDICSATNWYFIPGTGTGGPTGFGFDQYRAIIIGDPGCNTSTPNYLAALTALNATKTTWTPAAAGNAILLGVDNVYHAWGTNGAATTINRGIAFAVDDPTKTGFYYALSCYYDYTAPATIPTLVPQLTGFGTFMTRNYTVCFNDAHIVATHPVFTNSPPLTDADLSGWNCSTHEGFDVWPPNFVVLAIALTNGTYNASDGSNGIPYILVRGKGVKVISPIELGPPTATNNIGTTHTVCATLATNVFPKANVVVTFTISSGPNSVTNYSTVTDSNGVACFTYMGNGGLGVDYITASYTDQADHIFTSDVVTKIWQGACVNVGCQTLECLSDGTWIYNFSVTNLEGFPLTALSLFNAPAGVSFTPGFINLAPPLGIGQGTNLSVTINGPITLTNICFKVGTYTTNKGVLNCSIPNCLSLPTCCNRVITNTLTFVSTVGLVSYYNYSITLQNVTGSPLKFVGFGADQSCVTFVPALIDLTLPAYGGPSLLLPSQTRTLNLQVQRTAPCPGTNTFHLSTFDTNLIACCSTKVTLPPARCVKMVSPYDGSVVLTNTPVLARAIPFGPCGLIWVKFYDGPTYLGDAVPNPVGGYDLTLNNLPAGIHRLSAVAELGSSTGETGEVETSDPVELTVLAPGPNPDQHNPIPPVLSAGVTGDTILLSLPTVSGQQYAMEYRTNLVAGGWQTLQTIAGDGSVKIIMDSVTNDPNRFYRAVVLP
jgi:hypothetical protein